jgi:DNA mismatch repair ATPase MutL
VKLVGIIGTAVLSLTLAAPVYAQQEQHDQQEDKDKPAEKKAQPEKPAKQEEKTAKPAEKISQQEKSAKPEEKNAKQENNAKPEEKNAKQENNARPEEKNQRAGGGRIPDDRYKANFGQGHTFRVNQGDYSSRRFEYGGYSFGFVGEWPSNWLYTQNVYVIDIDGVYYLCNPMYPGVNIELNVNL